MGASLQEVEAELAQAFNRHDHDLIGRLADELAMMGTDDALTAASMSLGVLCYLRSEPDASRDHLKDAIHRAHTINNRHREARAHNALGAVELQLGNNDEAFIHLSEAQRIFFDLKDDVAETSVLSNLAAIHIVRSEHVKALECYYTVLERQERIGDQFGIAIALGNIGNIKSLVESYESAIQDYSRALDLHIALDNRAGIAGVRLHLSGAYDGLGDIDSSLAHALQALQIYTELEEPDGVGRSACTAVNTLLKAERVVEAETLLPTALNCNSSDPWIRMSCWDSLAAIKQHHGEIEQATTLARDALALAEHHGVQNYELLLHRKIRELSRLRGDLDAYVFHNEAHDSLKQRIASASTLQRIAVLDADRHLSDERREREKERAILYSALPKALADRMIRGESVTGDHYSDAAVLFADVVGFTSFTSDMPPMEVVSFLDTLFHTFDEICDRFEVTKVKTIGDSYMCFKADEQKWTNAEAISNVAVAVQSLAIHWPTGEPLLLRIGIHQGPVTAGVIGSQRIQYDVWGDTVNVASRMESTGEAGRIHVSSDFARALQDEESTTRRSEISLLLRGDVEIKGKGAMQTYWLEGS
ncbi:MAG: tetratricopeptide repeat protein [Ignavibacteria bacterium]|nr:tetratricopeptide repeat protein [Ignavibacteria bacterium]